MAEWRLFEAGTVPVWTTAEFFAAHPWVSPAHQAGHGQRTRMVAALVRRFVHSHPVESLVDLGCGDGSLLNLLRDLPVAMWGYDAGVENCERGWLANLDVRRADLFTDPIEYGELIVASEVVEHLVDPHKFLAALPGERLVVSSPSAETGEWHYEHHAWAWDLDGYAQLVTDAGWTVVEQVECSGGVNFHGGSCRPQRFQAISAVR